MHETVVLNWVLYNLRRIESVQERLVQRIDAWEAKRCGIILDQRIDPINGFLGCALGFMACLEFYFFRSAFEILTGEELFVVRHNK